MGTTIRQRLFVALFVLCSLFWSSPALTGAAATVTAPDVELLSATGDGIVLKLTTPSYALSAAATAGDCQQVNVPGFVQSAETGKPQMPVRVVLLGVPPGVELDLQVTDTRLPKRQTDAWVCPAQAPTREEQADGSAAAEVHAEPDAAIYAADRLYPGQTVRMEEVGFLRSQRIVRLELSPFQFNPQRRELLVHPELRVTLRFRGGRAAVAAVEEPAEFESALGRTLLNYEAARSWRAATPLVAPTATWTPPQPGYRVSVRKDGIYRLTRQDLATAGLPVATLDPRTFRLISMGQEIAIRVTGEADGRFDEGDDILFYGLAADTKYTDTNIYWLTYGGNPGLRMSERTSLPGGTAATSFLSSLFFEDNLFYLSNLPMEANIEHWYGLRLQVAGAGNIGRRDFNITVPQVAAGGAQAALEMLLAGHIEGTHHLRVYLNGQQIHETTWFGRILYSKTVSFPHSHLREGANTIRLELINDAPGQTIDMVHVDWMRLSYQRNYVAENDGLAFGGDAAGAWRYRITGFTAPDVEVYDITNPLQVVRITGAAVTPEAGLGQVLAFGDNQSTPKRYLALANAQRLSPAGIVLDTVSNLLAADPGADDIIITHRDFRQAIQPLATHRAALGRRIAVVDVQDVYDQFGYGLTSVEAIRDFLAYAYANWRAPAPVSALLVGDGTYDPRRYLGTSGPTYIPPYLEMVDPDLGETATDNRFVAINGNDILPDLNIGRLPANTAAEATAMVEKILAYATISPDATWTRNILFVADNLEGGGGNFYALSDDIADGYQGRYKILPAPYAPKKIYLGETCADEDPSIACRQQIIDAVNGDGAFMVSYIGHGTKTYWAAEHLYDASALAQLSAAGRFPIMLPMTCNEGFFHEAQLGSESLSEAGVRKPNSGVVASWAPTGYGLSSGHDFLERGLFLSMFWDRIDELGAATTAAKLYLVAHAAPGKYRDLIDTFLLLGDPALRVPLQAPPKLSTFMPSLYKGGR